MEHLELLSARDFLTTMMVAAFWAYVTDISTADQAKRLYGIVGPAELSVDGPVQPCQS